MVIFLILSVVLIKSLKTTTTTCFNEPLVFKLDIRERIQNLGQNGTIDQLDPESICNETYQYDYIWMTQLWTPSIYNYDNPQSPQQASNYRELQNIKEYDFDPQLGTKQQLLTFIQSLKSICYHIKILGEFSFYIGEDSSLLMNKTRFLQRPNSISINEQNIRYQDNGYIWAFNSQGQTVPYTAVWNLFQKAPIQDIQDIIYNQILINHQLDGIVFLQPSLGLFSVANYYYQQEILAYGDSSMKFDFYKNFGIKYNSSNYYFMGDIDNLMLKPLLLSTGLMQIYGLPPKSNTWVQVNYTFDLDPDYHSENIIVTDLTAYYNNTQTNMQVRNAVVKQPLLSNAQQCININITNAINYKASGTGLGLGTVISLKSILYNQPYNSAQIGLKVLYAGNILTNYYGVYDYTAGFPLYDNDIVQVQYDDFEYNLVFHKLSSSFKRHYQNTYSQSTNSRFVIALKINKTKLSIAFPFYFTKNLKSQYLQLNGERHIQSIQNSSYLQFAQVLQSINQYEDNTTLNILILNISNEQIVALGICNKDLMKYNQHQLIYNINSGAYLLKSDGNLIHSSVQNNQQPQNEGFQQWDLLSVTFTKANYSIMFSKNDQFLYSMALGQYVKNLHFCVGLQSQWTSVSLEY